MIRGDQATNNTLRYKFMPRNEKVTTAKNWPFVVVGCIIGRRDRILLVKEAYVEAGKWNQPAGWLEKGESPLVGAKREAEEETGLKVKIKRFLGVYSLKRLNIKGWADEVMDLHCIKLIFSAEAIMPKRQKSLDLAEISECHWFTMPEIIKLHKHGVLRDADIIQEAKDYFRGKGAATNLVCHTIQDLAKKLR